MVEYKPRERVRPTVSAMGFGGYELPPSPPAGHIHEEIEISAFKHGSVTMLYGGRPVTIPQDRLIVHWGMLPHQVLNRDPHAVVIGLHIPLAWIMQWRLPSAFVARLLNLELMLEPKREHPCSDIALLQNWCQILRDQSNGATEIVLAEARGRLLRIAATRSNTETTVFAWSDGAGSRVFDQALVLIASHFREPLRISDIAEAAGISPRHLTRLFRLHTGQTINRYISRLRTVDAQRLLVTTGRKIVDIMNEAGFSCSTHFYRVFREYAGCTPREYREQYTRSHA